MPRITLIYGYNGAGKTQVLQELSSQNRAIVAPFRGMQFTGSPSDDRGRVEAWLAERQGAALIRPEDGIHPLLQLEVAEAIIQHGGEFIIETHSEALVLRCSRRIRETTDGELPNGHKGLRPEDVRVLWVSDGRAEELRFDEDGDFIDRWPDGFFDWRFTELF